MEKFDILTAVAAPYPHTNVDTDRIIRIERCARTPREQMGSWAFEVERFIADGSDNPQFVLNRAPFRGAGILVAGENFGCGSSREMAVWAIAGMGIRCVIAPSFGEIFFGNCFQNGLLPIRLDASEVEGLLQRLGALAAGETKKATLSVDLRSCQISTPWGEAIGFEVEPMRRQMLLEGLDPVGLTLRQEAQIDAFQRADRQRRPWIHQV
ncbi:MAG: 3-isopropylmalate dehydratase small subunit [Quisquiliibacterium sp.]